MSLTTDPTPTDRLRLWQGESLMGEDWTVYLTHAAHSLRPLPGRTAGRHHRYHLGLLWPEYPQRYEREFLAPAAQRDRALDVLLRPLGGRLQSMPLLGSATPGATDLAMMPFVRQFASEDRQWFATLDLPSVRSWLNGWLADPLLAACMVKIPAEGANRSPALTLARQPVRSQPRAELANDRSVQRC